MMTTFVFRVRNVPAALYGVSMTKLKGFFPRALRALGVYPAPPARETHG